jgi:hypothetical protein
VEEPSERMNETTSGAGAGAGALALVDASSMATAISCVVEVCADMVPRAEQPNLPTVGRSAGKIDFSATVSIINNHLEH